MPQITLRWEDKTRGRAIMEADGRPLVILVLREGVWRIKKGTELPEGLRAMLVDLIDDEEHDGDLLPDPGHPKFRKIMEKAHTSLKETFSKIAMIYEEWLDDRAKDIEWLRYWPRKWIWDAEDKYAFRME